MPRVPPLRRRNEDLRRIRMAGLRDYSDTEEEFWCWAGASAPGSWGYGTGLWNWTVVPEQA